MWRERPLIFRKPYPAGQQHLPRNIGTRCFSNLWNSNMNGKSSWTCRSICRASSPTASDHHQDYVHKCKDTMFEITWSFHGIFFLSKMVQREILVQAMRFHKLLTKIIDRCSVDVDSAEFFHLLVCMYTYNLTRCLTTLQLYKKGTATVWVYGVQDIAKISQTNDLLPTAHSHRSFQFLHNIGDVHV